MWFAIDLSRRIDEINNERNLLFLPRGFAIRACKSILTVHAKKLSNRRRCRRALWEGWVRRQQGVCVWVRLVFDRQVVQEEPVEHLYHTRVVCLSQVPTIIDELNGIDGCQKGLQRVNYSIDGRTHIEQERRRSYRNYSTGSLSPLHLPACDLRTLAHKVDNVRLDSVW